jgi:hypothetical protein
MLPNTAVASLAKRTTGFITGWVRRKKPSRLSNRASVSKSPAIRKTTPRETLQALGIIVELTECEATVEKIELYGESARSADIEVYLDERSVSVYGPLIDALLADLNGPSHSIEPDDLENATDPIDMSRRAIERALLQRLNQ